MPHKRSRLARYRKLRKRLSAPSQTLNIWQPLLSHIRDRLLSTPYNIAVPRPPFVTLKVWQHLSRVVSDLQSRRSESGVIDKFLQAEDSKIRSRLYQKFLYQVHYLRGVPKPVYFDFGFIKVRSGKTHFVSYMPSKNKRRTKGAKGGGMETSSGLRGVVVGDLALVPRNPIKVPKRVPKTFANDICWTTFKLDSTITPSATFSETGFAFFLGQYNQSSQYQALFDQYCIVQAAVTWQSLVPPGSSSSTMPVLHSLIDFDGVSALGSLAAYENYESHTVDILQPGKSVTRMCMPCIQTAVGVGGSSSSVNSANMRSWVSTANPNTPHYGIRGAFEAGSTGANVVHIVQTLWIAFRFGT
jgi:hypothetical protein